MQEVIFLTFLRKPVILKSSCFSLLVSKLTIYQQVFQEIRERWSKDHVADLANILCLRSRLRKARKSIQTDRKVKEKA
jgi:hypothetical protein